MQQSPGFAVQLKLQQLQLQLQQPQQQQLQQPQQQQLQQQSQQQNVEVATNLILIHGKKNPKNQSLILGFRK